MLRTGDILQIFAKEEFFIKPEKKIIHQESYQFQVVFEDEKLLIVRKAAGQDAHGSVHSLIAEIQAYLHDKCEYHPQTEQSFSPALCNRIDRNTEGLVIAAKTAAALRAMAEAIRAHQVQKTYLAVTARPLPKKSGLCTAYLHKEENSPRVRIADAPQGKDWHEIRTGYEVLAQNGQKQLVRVTLLTGRTHQIRAHMAFLGAPLLGDAKYGGKSDTEQYQCLCAYQLRFSGLTSPVLAYLEGKSFSAPVPDFVKKYFPDYLSRCSAL